MAQFTVGERIMWVSNPEEKGRVCEVGYNAIKVKWDDGGHSLLSLRAGAEGSIAQIVRVHEPK
jgi:hypothetical protein